MSTERKTLDKPEVESEPVAVREVGETYQPFDPLVVVMFKPNVGRTVSTFAEKVPMLELSPHEDKAQKVKSLFPSFKDTLQLSPEQAKVCPFNEPSTARMLYPDRGSVPFKDSSEVVLHQPLLRLHPCNAEAIVASGWVVVTV